MDSNSIQILLSNLNALSEATGYSQTEVARQSGLAQKTVNNLFRSLETGTSPKLETIEQLAKAFNITVAELLSPKMIAIEPVQYTVTNTLPKTLGRLIEDFLQSDKKGQKEILFTAQAESERTINDKKA